MIRSLKKIVHNMKQHPLLLLLFIEREDVDCFEEETSV